MNQNYRITPFAEEHIDDVLGLWDEVYPEYPLDRGHLQRHTFRHPDYDPAGGLVVLADGVLVAFSLVVDHCINEGPLTEVGARLPVLMVAKAHRMQGIGAELLKRSENYMRKKGHEVMRVGYPTYVQNSVLSFLGIEAGWMDAHWFYAHYGYSVVGSIDSARCPLQKFVISPKVQGQIDRLAADGIVATIATAADEAALMAYLEKDFSETWYRHFVKRVSGGFLLHENVVILKGAGEVFGFVGPLDISPSGVVHMGVGIGVDGSQRGKGLGNVILYSLLNLLKERGAQECLIYGVGPRRYYEKAGFHMSELWLMMEKKL